MANKKKITGACQNKHCPGKKVNGKPNPATVEISFPKTMKLCQDCWQSIGP